VSSLLTAVAKMSLPPPLQLTMIVIGAVNDDDKRKPLAFGRSSSSTVAVAMAVVNDGNSGRR
jgi:hypothetical protein